MKTSHPQLALACALAVLAASLFAVSCRRKEAREILRIRITHNPTHISVGQSAQLRAFEE